MRNVFYNNTQLMDLISKIYDLCGIWINIHDLSGKDIQIRDAHTDFCRAINNLPEGHARCVTCDAKASDICREIKHAYHYRCHAGICETLVPIFDKGEVISYLGFGQLLADYPPPKNNGPAPRQPFPGIPVIQKSFTQNFSAFQNVQQKNPMRSQASFRFLPPM